MSRRRASATTEARRQRAEVAHQAGVDALEAAGDAGLRLSRRTDFAAGTIDQRVGHALRRKGQAEYRNEDPTRIYPKGTA